MKGSKETFMDQREAELQMEEEEEMEGYYYPHPKGYHAKRKPVKTFREKVDDPIAEHDEREWKEAIDKRIE